MSNVWKGEKQLSILSDISACQSEKVNLITVKENFKLSGISTQESETRTNLFLNKLTTIVCFLM